MKNTNPNETKGRWWNEFRCTLQYVYVEIYSNEICVCVYVYFRVYVGTYYIFLLLSPSLF